MNKFKLTKNDSQSLKNTMNLISNSVLKNAALDVTSSPFSGGYSRVVWAKVEQGWGKAIQ
jgi:hypothetical protein